MKRPDQAASPDADLPDALRGDGATATPAGSPEAIELHLDAPLTEARNRVVSEFERRYLDAVLRDTDGAVGRTAERAGINPRTLYEKMRRYGLRKEDYA